MVNHLISFQKHAHILPRQQDLPVNKSFFVSQNDSPTKKSGQIKFSSACGQKKAKERGTGKWEPVGMAKDFNFQMPVIYFMFKLTIWVTSTTTANFKSITQSIVNSSNV